MHIFQDAYGTFCCKLKAFDTIGNWSKVCYKSEKRKEAVGQEKSMLPAASLWLIIVCMRVR